MNKKLNKYGLMQLRIYAKNIGVKAPTAYTKTELIKKIEQVENGIVPPHFTDKGRPQINTFVDFDKTKNEEDISDIQIENLEVRKKILELNNISIKLEKTFYDFKKTLIEIFKEL